MPAAVLALILGASNLLEGLPSPRPHLTDGVTAGEGDPWLAPGAFELKGDEVWDLGAPRHVGAAALQADHNDTYVLAVSDDGVAWRDAWTADPVPEAGLRTRSGTFDATARFVRLTATGGDGHFSAAELQLFDGARDLAIAQWRLWPPVPLAIDWTWLLAAVAIALCVRGPLRLVGTALALAAAWVVRATWVLPAMPPALLDWIRGVIAVASLIAVVRAKAAPRALVTSVLAVAAGLALLAFLNFGRAQFDDTRGPTFLHHYDMRVYFPIARFFPELRFTHVYAASAAVVQEDTGLTAELAAVPMTDLAAGQRRTVGELQDQVRAARARFTDARWAEFRKEMGYFRAAMGDRGFLHTMQDNGGNATPVWFLGARALFLGAPASDAALWLGVIADVVLMLAAFAAIGWAYGPRAALIAAIGFGAVDVYMFGSNWFGSTLRHDWMALWAIAIALLKKERFFLGGGLLAWAALIRVFPVISFVTLLGPLAWGLWTQRRAFAWRPYARGAAGAAVFGVALVALSTLVFGLEAWPLWSTKILAMTGGRGINTVGLSNFVTVPWVKALIVVGTLLLTLAALRKAPVDEAAAFGPALVAVAFSAMNYYLHCVFILAVLGRDERRTPWVVLLAMAVGGCWASRISAFEAHFDREAIVALAGMAALIVWRFVSERRDRQPVQRPVPAGPSGLEALDAERAGQQ